jgi:hypothetical protein
MKKLLTIMAVLTAINTSYASECAVYSKDHQTKEIPNALYHLTFNEKAARNITESEYNAVCHGETFCMEGGNYYGKYEIDLDSIHIPDLYEEGMVVIPRYSRFSKENSIDIIEGDTKAGFYVNNRMKLCSKVLPYTIFVSYTPPKNYISTLDKYVGVITTEIEI